MARQLFGTDGIRGVAGEYPLDPRTVFSFGAALGTWAMAHADNDISPTVLLGMDTRESGPELAELVAGGLQSRGVRVRFAGVITTPGVAYLTRTGDFVAGVMISASHNPYRDNGLKAFDHSGYKLPDEQELEVERDILGMRDQVQAERVFLQVEPELANDYVDFLESTVPQGLAGLRIVADCANGAAYDIAPRLFRRLGATVEETHSSPDGRNINAGCGALHPEAVREEVLRRGTGMGVAFDGDADRAMLVSDSGKVIDGDHVLLLAAQALLAQGKLPGQNGQPLVIATVMSNLGLERALRNLGVKLIRTPVGDKYVLEEMLRSGAAIGGEQSGHVIFREFATTGDGILTALQVLGIARQSGKSLDELTAALQVYPQKLVNVRVGQRRPLDDLPQVQEEIRSVESELGDQGRVLVRFSGTEPLVRVMVEGPDVATVESSAQRIAARLQEALQ